MINQAKIKLKKLLKDFTIPKLEALIQ